MKHISHDIGIHFLICWSGYLGGNEDYVDRVKITIQKINILRS